MVNRKLNFRTFWVPAYSLVLSHRNDMSHLVALQLLDSSEEAIKTAKRTKDLQDSVIDGQHTLISMGQAALLTEQRWHSA